MPTNLTPTAPDEILHGPIKSKTVLPVLVLHILAGGSEHGFALMQRIEEICGGLLAANTNTMYPLLRRLEERGFIDGAWDHPTKRARRYYSITPAGRERLERIKVNMLPYLDSLTASLHRLRRELYATPSRAEADPWFDLPTIREEQP
jgi:DNA-binding PadR family transcriptional regulator